MLPRHPPQSLAILQSPAAHFPAEESDQTKKRNGLHCPKDRLHENWREALAPAAVILQLVKNVLRFGRRAWPRVRARCRGGTRDRGCRARKRRAFDQHRHSSTLE